MAQILLVVGLVLVVIIGRVLAAKMAEGARKSVGGISILVGVVLAFDGITHLNSTGSQLNYDAMKSLGIGLVAVAFGLTLLVSRGSGKAVISSDSIKKCPFCAETIQAGAIVCRYCGKSVGETGNSEVG